MPLVEPIEKPHSNWEDEAKVLDIASHPRKTAGRLFRGLVLEDLFAPGILMASTDAMSIQVPEFW